MLAGQGAGLKSAAQSFSRASKPLVEMGFKALGGQTGRELGQAGLSLLGQSGNAATMVTGDPRYAEMTAALGTAARGIPNLIKREMTVGRNANLNPEQKQGLAMAQRMWNELKEQGVHPDKMAEIIKRETGWHPVPQGANKPVEFGLEISDKASKAAINHNSPTTGGSLQHPDLYQLYPDLEKMPLEYRRMPKNVRGGYDAIDHGIEMNSQLPEDLLRETLLHELQHRIQHIEGWPRGADLASPEVKQFANQYLSALEGAGKIPPGHHPAEYYQDAKTLGYKRSAGESQAFLTENNRDLTNEQLRAMPPPTAQYPYRTDQMLYAFNENPAFKTTPTFPGSAGNSSPGMMQSAITPGLNQKGSALATIAGNPNSARQKGSLPPGFGF